MLRKYLDRKHDSAISPVIGTILMIAATVIIAGAVYAAVNIYGGKSAKPPVDAAWKAQTLDTNSNGVDETVKVTYLNGPTGVTFGANGITLTVKDAAGNSLSQQTASPASMSPGDYLTFVRCTAVNTPAGCTAAQAASQALSGGQLAAYVTVAQSGTALLDQQVTLKE